MKYSTTSSEAEKDNFRLPQNIPLFVAPRVVTNSESADTISKGEVAEAKVSQTLVEETPTNPVVSADTVVSAETEATRVAVISESASVSETSKVEEQAAESRDNKTLTIEFSASDSSESKTGLQENIEYQQKLVSQFEDFSLQFQKDRQLILSELESIKQRLDEQIKSFQQNRRNLTPITFDVPISEDSEELVEIVDSELPTVIHGNDNKISVQYHNEDLYASQTELLEQATGYQPEPVADLAVLVTQNSSSEQLNAKNLAFVDHDYYADFSPQTISVKLKEELNLTPVADEVLALVSNPTASEQDLSEAVVESSPELTVEDSSEIESGDQSLNQTTISNEQPAYGIFTDFKGVERSVKLSKYYPEYQFDVDDLFKEQPVILEAKHLSKEYVIREGWFKKTVINAVKDVSFKLHEGETLSIVGESGSGKTTLAKLITNIEDFKDGELFFKSKKIDYKDKAVSKLRRKEIQVIFQNPHSSLNPRKTIYKILEEPLILNTDLTKEERRARIEEMITDVGLSVEHLKRYPHMFSGGQKQRIAIARGLILKPSIVVADEAVSALDVSVQAQILNLMLELQKKYNLSYIFISHDLSVVRHISHRIMVMFHGDVVEYGSVDQVYNNPQHEYTRKLLEAVPKLPMCVKGMEHLPECKRLKAKREAEARAKAEAEARAKAKAETQASESV